MEQTKEAINKITDAFKLLEDRLRKAYKHIMENFPVQILYVPRSIEEGVVGVSFIMTLAHEGVASGEVHLSKNYDGYAYMSNLWVIPKMRRCGIGEMLQAAREAYVINCLYLWPGVNRIKLTVETGSWMQDWYYRRGYRVEESVGERTTMSKPIEMVKRDIKKYYEIDLS